MAAYCNIIVSYERYCLDIVFSISLQNFWLHFFYYQNIYIFFLKLCKSLFLWIVVCLINFLFGYFQDKCEYFWKIIVFVLTIFNISRKCNLINKSYIHNICEHIFQGYTFSARHNRLQRNNYIKKVTSITKCREFSRIFGHI